MTYRGARTRTGFGPRPCRYSPIDPQDSTTIARTSGRGAWRSLMPHPSDIEPDGSIDGLDLTVLLAEWGSSCQAGFGCRSDLDRNGLVDGFDLAELLANWGG